MRANIYHSGFFWGRSARIERSEETSASLGKLGGGHRRYLKKFFDDLIENVFKLATKGFLASLNTIMWSEETFGIPGGQGGCCQRGRRS